MTETSVAQLPDTETEYAADRMVTHIPTTNVGVLVSEVIEDLRGSHYDCADTIFVVDESRRLKGIVRINDLFSGEERQIGEIMEPRHEAVPMDADQETVAMLAMEMDMIAVPVVDETGRLKGAVPPERLFRILRQEHMEDLQRIVGIMPQEDGGHYVLDDTTFNRLRRRLPWLIVGLFASSLVTWVMVGFEHSLEANVAVAFFVPALVYIAGAIGSQAVSVAVRALSSGELPLGRLIGQELIVGTAIGLALALISVIPVYLAFSDFGLAIAVSLAVFGSGTVSAVVGFALPWLFQRMGSDPAMGSGPICTIVQDVASLVIYFLVVNAILL